MSEINKDEFDLTKNVFVTFGASSIHVHEAGVQSWTMLRKKLWHDQVLVLSSQPLRCVVAKGACGGAHISGFKIEKTGHEVRLIPPGYVKPFV